MVFKAPPKLLQKVVGLGAFKFDGGKLLVTHIPCVLTPLYSFVHHFKVLEDYIGREKAQVYFYNMGIFQGKQTFELLTERFGFADKIPNKLDLLNFAVGEGDLAGYGSFKWVRADFKNEHFIGQGHSNIAEEFKLVFGPQKDPVDAFLCGEATGIIESLVGKDDYMLGIETKCLASKSNSCQFVIKPKKKWKDSELKGWRKNIKRLKTEEELHHVLNRAKQFS